MNAFRKCPFLSIFNSWLRYLSFYCLCSFSGCCHGNLTWPLIASWVLTSACTPLLKPRKNKWQMALLQSPSHTFLHKETTLGVQMLTIPSKVFQRVHNTSDRTKKKKEKNVGFVNNRPNCPSAAMSQSNGYNKTDFTFSGWSFGSLYWMTTQPSSHQPPRRFQ